MFALLALPFKLAALLLSTAFGVLRGLIGFAGLLANPFVLFIVAIILAALFLF